MKMPDKKSNAEATSDSSEHVQRKVRIHNRFAGRPLSFQIPGKSVRLGPGESEILPKDFLNAHELHCLCRAGLVVVEDLPMTKTSKQKKEQTASAPTSQSLKESGEKETKDTQKATVQRLKAKSSSDKPLREDDKTDSSGKKRKEDK